MNIERQCQINRDRHFAADDRAIAKMERKMDKAIALIGQLCRNGETVYYITKNTNRGLKVIEGSYYELLTKAMEMVR